MKERDKQKIAVIAGAGPAGLTAAYELKKRTDIDPIVCESAGIVGGLSRTVSYNGNRLDLGGHRFYTKSKRVQDWWFSILPVEIDSPDTQSRTVEEWGNVDDSDREVEYLLRIEDVNTKDINSVRNTQRYRRVREPAPNPEISDKVMLSRNRLSRIFFNNVFFPYPLSFSISVIRRLGIVQSGLFFLSYIKAHIFPKKDETYLDNFFINRFGNRLYEQFFRDYTEKVWGVPCSSIRADWGAQRIKGLSLRVALKHAIIDSFSRTTHKLKSDREISLINHFYYPKHGPGQMWSTVAEQVVGAGGDIRLSHSVNGVYIEDNEVTSVTVIDENGNSYQLECDYFFSTMPIKELVNMIRPKPPEEVLRVGNGLIYRDFFTVGITVKNLDVEIRNSNGLLSRLCNKLNLSLGTRVANVVPDNWIYIQDGSVKVGRIQIYNNWSPYMVSDPHNTVSLGLEYFANQEDDLWQMPDEELIDYAIEELERINFAKKSNVLDCHVERMTKAYPAYFGTYNELNTVYDYVNSVGNLFLVGRNGLHRYNNQDHSMMTAMLAVDLIEAKKLDKTIIFRCNIDSDYQEENPRSPTAPRV
jgi:protoporphyrinogen oxidase